MNGGGYLRDVGSRPGRPARDPLGKAALFSDEPIVEARPETKSVADAWRPGTVVIDCQECDASTRVSYVDFVLANLPFAVWLPPLPNIPFNRKMTCPACDEWAWTRAHWLR
jgi:hypothetical protein